METRQALIKNDITQDALDDIGINELSPGMVVSVSNIDKYNLYPYRGSQIKHESMDWTYLIYTNWLEFID